MEQLLCPNCHIQVADSFYFCPNCGKKLKEHLSTGIGAQLGLYALSLLLPPLGLFPGIKYASQSDTKTRTIGVTAIVLTIVSLLLTFWFTYVFFKGTTNALHTQMNQYQNLGY